MTVLALLGLPAHPPPLAPARTRHRATLIRESAPCDDAFHAWTELVPAADPASPWDGVAGRPP